MKLLMLSTDPKLLDPESAVAKRMAEYGTLVDTLTVVLAGRGKQSEVKREGYRLVYPGGGSKIENFFRIVYAARIIEANVVSAQDPFYMGLAGVLSGKRPLQIQLHTDTWGIVAGLLARVTLHRASCVRAVSEHVAQKIKHLTKKPISILPIYVDTARASLETVAPKEFVGRPAIVTVSRLAPEKKIDLVIRAVSGLPDAHLYVIGDGPLLQSLQGLVRNLNLSDRVHFLGWQHHTTPYLQHADCFVQASAFEGYGMSLIDAIVAGCPAVSTPVGIARSLPHELVTIARATEYDLRMAILSSLSEGSRAPRREAREALLRSMPAKAEYLQQYQELLQTCGQWP